MKNTLRVLRYLLLGVLLVLVLLVVGGVVVYNDWTNGVLPQHNGELRAVGLQNRVEIRRDEWGVPHIYASSLHDLFFAQGFTQAQDRWWQMEFFRHVGSGRIQELTGKSGALLGTDVFIRTVGWRRAAERDLTAYDAVTLSYMQAFADGVNAYIAGKQPGDLAFEYNVLGLTGVSITVEPWTPLDTLTFAKIMAWDLGGNRSDELLRARLYETLGQAMTDILLPDFPYADKPTMILPDELPAVSGDSTGTDSSSGDRGYHTSTLLAGSVPADFPFAFGTGDGIGSNNWVVSGAMTASGKPMLANDPHLGIQMPSIWYEIGLHCQPLSDECPLDVVGFTFAAAPAVVVGHNGRIAWGVTTLNMDVQDMYRLKINPDNPLQYEWNGEWRDMTVRDEVVRFGDGGEISIKVRETHLGPVLNDNRIDLDTGAPSGYNMDDPMALHWTAIVEPSALFKAVLNVNLAANWDEFRQALSDWDVAAQNFVYADMDGNIGYQSTGRLPIRAANHDGRLPVDGWTDTFEWRGYVPFEDMPTLYNPTRGYIVTANNAVVPQDYDALMDARLGDGTYLINQDGQYGYRAARIVQMVQDFAPHDLATFQRMHIDNQVIGFFELKPYFEALTFDDANVTAARDWLLTWDGQMGMDSPQAALFAYVWSKLLPGVFADQIDADTPMYAGEQGFASLLLLVQDPQNVWWDDISTADATETRDDVLRRAFADGYAAAVTALGSSRDSWRWGTLHTAVFVSNPLGLSGIGPIEGIVNRGPVATGGCAACVNATAFDGAYGDFTVNWLPSFRMIVDFADLTASVAIHTTGQSGHPASSHYSDMIDLWRTGQYHAMLWTSAQVDAAARQTLVLLPAP